MRKITVQSCGNLWVSQYIYFLILLSVQHNRSILDPGPAWNTALQLYTYVKNLADVVIPQVRFFLYWLLS